MIASLKDVQESVPVVVEHQGVFEVGLRLDGELEHGFLVLDDQSLHEADRVPQHHVHGGVLVD